MGVPGSEEVGRPNLRANDRFAAMTRPSKSWQYAGSALVSHGPSPFSGVEAVATPATVSLNTADMWMCIGAGG